MMSAYARWYSSPVGSSCESSAGMWCWLAASGTLGSMPLMHQSKYSVPYSALTPSSELLNARTISLRISEHLGLRSCGYLH